MGSNPTPSVNRNDHAIQNEKTGEKVTFACLSL